MVQSPLLRLLCGLCCSSAVFVSAAPALVWSSIGSNTGVGSHSSRESTGSIYTSEEIAAAALFDNNHNGDAANLQVVFVLGRGSDGTESLTRMAPFLSGIAQRSPAHYVHSHVTGVESVEALKRTVSKSSRNTAAVSVVGLNELGMKFNASELDQRQDKPTKKSREISAANVLLVDVSAQTSPEVLDDAVRQALARADRVVLTAIRSIDEVKEERAKIARRRMEMQYQAGAHVGHDGRNHHRRLENNNNNNNQQQQQQQQANDQAGVYFVQMTPNILSGLLFFFLFATIAAIGISCMGMIAANDTYVKKMPAVGREA